MEHFQIVQALCRAAIANGSVAARRQVERLRDATRASADEETAKSLDLLLTQSSKATEMAPSKLTQSRARIPPLEELSKNVSMPVDRETAAPLADLYFPDTLPEQMPLFSQKLTVAAETLVAEWQNVEQLAAFGVEPANSCLIYGPPGTGKTSLALWMARKLNLPAVVARLDGLISSFLGTTSRNVGNLFTFANRYRCILVLDEFDAIAKVRDDPHEVGEVKRVVNALLQNIDSRRKLGLTFAVTNHESLLDPAIWRRFEIQLEIPKPNLEARIAIVNRYLPPLELGGAALRLVAWATDGLSGAEIETFVKGIKKHLALNNLDQGKILNALQHLVVLNGARLNANCVRALELEPQELAQWLLRDGKLGLTQSDVGIILNRDKTTIGRWVKPN
jgi:hypothetical protein